MPATAAEVKVGLLYPGHAAEDDFALLASRVSPPVDVRVVHTEMQSYEDVVNKIALRGLGEERRLLAGAERLRSFAPNVVVWACTSGSFLWERAGAASQAACLGQALGVPASSSSLAFLAALKALGLWRVAVGAPYDKEVTEAFTDFLATDGIDTVKVHHLDAETAAEIGTWGREQVIDIVERSDTPDAEAVLIPDTALHTIAWLEELEQHVGKPVLTSNQVTMWHAMRLAGAQDAQDGLGTLFRARLTPS